MKYLITGGCGFLGSNLGAEVLKRHQRLFVFDNLSRIGASQNLEWLKGLGTFEFIHADVRNQDQVDNTIKKIQPDIIFHLAGQVAMTTSIENPKLDFEINALGSLNVLDAVRKFYPNAIIIYSSTNKVYGDLEDIDYDETCSRYVSIDYSSGFPETISLDFHSPYGCSKGAADQYMLDYHRIFGIKTVVFRHSSMYGGRQFATYDQGWIGWFCQKAIEIQKGLLKEPFTISGNGKQVRDLLHADDMVRLYFNTADAIEIAKGHAFNIGGGIKNSLSLLELFDILESILKIKMQYTKLPPRISDQKVFVADISKINQFVKWYPEVDKLSGIKRMIEWVRKSFS